MNAAVVEAREPSARYLARAEPALVRGFDLLVSTQDGVPRLRDLVLALAVRGKLVEQLQGDEPVARLLERAQACRVDAGRGHSRKVEGKASVGKEESAFDLPLGWEWVGLPEITHNWGQKNPTAAFTYIDVASIDNERGLIIDQPQVLASAAAPSRARKAVKRGTVIFSTVRPYLKNIAIVERAYVPEPIASTAFAVMHPTEAVDARYLTYWLKSDVFTEFVASKMMGVAYPAINDSNFFEGVVALPPLAEQHRIVARVEELMQLCDALEQSGRLADEQHARLTSTLFDALAASESAHALAENWQRIAEHFDLLLDRPEAIDALEQTILQLAVRGSLVPQGPREAMPESTGSQLPQDAALFQLPETWLWTALESVLISGPSNGYSPKPSPTEVGVRCLTLSATTKGYFRGDYYKLIDISTTTAAQYYLKRGDLLIQRANSLEHVGIAAIYDGDDDKYTFPDLMMRMRVSPSLVSIEYLHLWLISTDARAYLRSRATGTQGNMPKVNQGVVRQVPVPLPPLAEQHRIVARVEELRRLCAQLRERLTAARQTQAQLADALVSQAVA